MSSIGFGVDIGGSGIKAARVDLKTGEFVDKRIKFETPSPATPHAVAKVISKILSTAQWDGPIGVTLPAIVTGQIARSAANIDHSWIGTDIPELLAEHVGDRKVSVLNDADAAGLAECEYGSPRAQKGSVLFLTIGTGIGSALFHDGVLFPNTEFGHVEVDKKQAEKRASSAVKERKEWSYNKWAKKLSKVLTTYEELLSPDLFILGGGISKHAAEWLPLLTNDTESIAASLQNRAGIVGAAMAVRDGLAP